MSFIQPFQKEVVDYKPKIDENANNGHTLDTLTKEAAQPVQAPPHYRSTEQGLKTHGEGKSSYKYDEPMGFIGKSWNTKNHLYWEQQKQQHNQIRFIKLYWK